MHYTCESVILGCIRQSCHRLLVPNILLYMVSREYIYIVAAYPNRYKSPISKYLFISRPQPHYSRHLKSTITMVSKAAITLAAVLSAFSATAASIDRRIVGGEDAKDGEFPFVVSITGTNGICGGALLDSTTVLTAASCLRGTVSVRAGSLVSLPPGAVGSIDEANNDVYSNTGPAEQRRKLPLESHTPIIN